MHTRIFSGAILGVEGLTVEVEVDIARGIPNFSIVGLPNTAVRESRERVTAAIKNVGLEFPLQRITVNLAPADIKKEGAAFDLAIAMGVVLAASSWRGSREGAREGACLGIEAASSSREAAGESRDSGADRDAEDAPPREHPWCRRTVFLGELALGGQIRRVRGVLPILLHAKREGFTRAVIPYGNFAESVYVSGVEVFACRRFTDVLDLVAASAGIAAEGPPLSGVIVENVKCGAMLHKGADHVERAVASADDEAAERHGDMRDVLGQETAKRALLVAAAGGHHVLLSGPPGAGKTMLARRFCSLLPVLDEEAALETTMIYSTAGLLDGSGLVTRAPFRAPHHSASDAGLIGGGNVPRPGEVTLSHNGVLFLDELPEFKRHVLETLREPLEEGRITISRAKSAVTFPARFQLIAAMNPCPCGYAGSTDRVCRCTELLIERYLGKISGPLLDRIAIHVFVRPVELSAFASEGSSSRETSACMRARVIEARERQRARLRREGVGLYAEGFSRRGVDVGSASRASTGGAVAGGSGILSSTSGNGAVSESGVSALNARLPEKLVKKFCRLDAPGSDLLIRAQKQLRVSARGRGHLMRVARTIADLDGSDTIRAAHVAEAVQYRMREEGR